MQKDKSFNHAEFQFSREYVILREAGCRERKDDLNLIRKFALKTIHQSQQTQPKNIIKRRIMNRAAIDADCLHDVLMPGVQAAYDMYLE